MLDKIIRQKLKEKDMTQRELAEETGLTESIISRYCHGTRNPRLYNVLKIAEVLDLTLDDLREN